MPPPPARPLRVAGMYSDLLHKPHWLASCALDAEWLARDTLPRAAGLSAAKFYADFEEPNVPVVITDVVRARLALHSDQPCCGGILLITALSLARLARDTLPRAAGLSVAQVRA